MSKRERAALEDALLEWRFVCAFRYIEHGWAAKYQQQLLTHVYELSGRDNAN